MAEGNDIIRQRDALKAARSPFESHWDELAKLFMPFRVMQTGGLPDIPAAREVFDSTPRQYALILANGLASLVMPREDTWFEFAPPRILREDDSAVSYYRQCSAIAREFLEGSNFYEEAQECLIETPVFGTTALFCGDLDEDQKLYFRNQPIKTYYISEDAQGRVVSFYRDLELTAAQAAIEFGEDALPQAVRGKVGDPDQAQTVDTYVHAVYRRREGAKKETPENGDDSPAASRKWESCVVHETSKQKVAHTGYHEFPFAVHRYRRFGRCAYGFGPGSVGLSDARQLQFLEQLADVAAEKSVFPPLIAPSNLEGEIGQGALEITYVDPSDPNAAALMREWATTGRYDVALDRLNQKRSQLSEIFHISLFQLFAQRQEKQPLTATEASLVAGEKLTQFSPVFGRLVSEFLDPVLQRVFGVLLRANAFPPAPPSVVRALGSKASVASPSLIYKNRVMLAMQQRENQALMDFMTMAQPIMAVYPEAMDALRLPQIVRRTARNNGLREEDIREVEEIEAMQESRAQAAQAQQQMAMAEQGASAAAKLSSAAPGMAERMLGGIA